MNRVPKALIFEQGTMLKSFASLIGREVLSFGVPANNPEHFDMVTTPLNLPSQRLIDHYIYWSGAGIFPYSKQVPPHLFFQLVMPKCIEQLKKTCYALSRIVNLGCTMTMHSPIPYDAELSAQIRIKRLRESMGRARIVQHIDIFIAEDELALELEIHTLLPMEVPTESTGTARKQKKPAVPQANYEELGSWCAQPWDGGDFALLTGDFNPIHWSNLAGRRSPFGGKVLHGFGTFVRSFELLQSQLGRKAKHIDVRFTAPLQLPGGENSLSHQPSDPKRISIPLQLSDHHGNLLMSGNYRVV